MNKWILLLRGINVGGNNILPMANLRALLDDLGCQNVKTYIQSGNAVFSADTGDRNKLETKITKAIEEKFGFAPRALLMSADNLHRALKANPFPQALEDPKTLHLSFLSAPVDQMDSESIEAIRADSERYAFIDNVFYLYAPDGIARSKLAVKAEKILGVPMTARNLRSAMKIAEMTSD